MGFLSSRIYFGISEILKHPSRLRLAEAEVQDDNFYSDRSTSAGLTFDIKKAGRAEPIIAIIIAADSP